MSRIGLALSGGGFRATLFHLGILRFLRDAGVLSRISDITSVSGGSVGAAHLVLNWQRYTGSAEEFDEAAGELIRFIRLDVRNRIVRRFPAAAAGNAFRLLLGLGRSRRWTRPGLLEAQYERHLYGDKCLYELPAMPQLQMLSTNLNEGCLCSFTRSGLLVERRNAGGGTNFELMPTTLATIPMAVTASSAFPGFFPPLQLTAHDVGLEEGGFPPHLFTDGGVYDNLGIRMFRHIQNSWIGQDAPLRADDFVDLEAANTALTAAVDSEAESPLGRLGRLARIRSEEQRDQHRTSSEDLPQNLWNVIVHNKLYCERAFLDLPLEDEQAAALLNLTKRDRVLEMGDHLRLNRALVQAAFRAAGVKRLLKSTNMKFDAVIVSDAGKPFAVSRRTKAGGLLGVALRSTDIVMDRVWQLELDHFGSEPDFLFALMTKTVELADDPCALHPEIQHQVSGVRTDLDRFSDLEISALIRHGYGVMRSVCRTRPDLFGEHLPSGPPWDPIRQTPESSSTLSASLVTRQARALQASSNRKIFSRLFSIRDWPSYLHVPLLLAATVGLPYFGYRTYKNASRSEMIVNAITYSNPDFQLVLQLARNNSIPGEWTSLKAEDVAELTPVGFNGFRLVTDTRIYDLRSWNPETTADGSSRVVSYRRLQVRRLPPNPTAAGPGSNQPANKFRLQQFGIHNNVLVRCDAKALQPILRIAPHVTAAGLSGFLYEIEFDLSSVPEGQDFAIGFEVTEGSAILGPIDPEMRLEFPILAPTDVATMWVLLPETHPSRNFSVIGYDPANPVNVKSITPTYDFRMADGSLLGWMLVAPRDGHMYECRWPWKVE
ncbi:patatin-like phospholipase family protein [Paludisphaera rhizosphaerae]|uniref:patatin-like phospholipase family protein n=1 Tax=Paludisphaera rhizosphaerae TaxID=2711216 RepID=UPI0013EB6ADA|nr:patatin-like phospholipase family protein [Paludisphaera rhizosphaerae]